MTTLTLSVQSSKKIELIPVTAEIQHLIESEKLKDGWLQVFVPHTTAGITINEQADPDVASDLAFFFNRLSPHLSQYRHFEGNSAAHVLSSLVGVSLMLTVADGQLRLGRWQGIFFCEFDGPRTRSILLNGSR